MPLHKGYAPQLRQVSAAAEKIRAHGGIALGLDRLVMLLGGKASIRDVIAFPKTSSASDPMTGAPSAVTGRQLKEVNLRTL